MFSYTSKNVIFVVDRNFYHFLYYKTHWTKTFFIEKKVISNIFLLNIFSISKISRIESSLYWVLHSQLYTNLYNNQYSIYLMHDFRHFEIHSTSFLFSLSHPIEIIKLYFRFFSKHYFSLWSHKYVHLLDP